ncbi:zinc ribbon-containing protein [Thiomicrospira sp.]|uniref:zinc ribbon-containing protein n=1 Tax=Thiomicrospira sp. TaxID=935 RepID=UPI002F92DB88
MSLSEKFQNAYNSLLDQLTFRLKNAEDASLHWLGKEISQIEQKGSELEVLTEHELEELQNLLKADVEQTAGYFNDLGKGVDAFIENDWPAIEATLTEKALTLADPSKIELLKLRLQAALNKD